MRRPETTRLSCLSCQRWFAAGLFAVKVAGLFKQYPDRWWQVAANGIVVKEAQPSGSKSGSRPKFGHHLSTKVSPTPSASVE
jgi:hypothetical protein